MTVAPKTETNPPSEMLAEKPAAGSPSWLTRGLALAGAIVSAIYLTNIGVGIFELIPDNLPVAGNIDEVLFTMLLIYCLRRLGIDLAPHLKSRLGQRRE